MLWFVSHRCSAKADFELLELETAFDIPSDVCKTDVLFDPDILFRNHSMVRVYSMARVYIMCFPIGRNAILGFRKNMLDKEKSRFTRKNSLVKNRLMGNEGLWLLKNN